MRHHLATLNAALLTPPTHARFLNLFAVAEPKSIFGWREAPLAQANLALLDSSLHELPVGLPDCVVLVGDSVSVALTSQLKRHFHLKPDFTVSQLLDILDRAAVCQLDLRGQGASPQASSTVTVLSYKLRRWAFLGAELSSTSSIRAMALLSTESMTLERLCRHSGLQPTQAQRLLAELTRLDVLHVTQATVRAHPSPATGDQQPRQQAVEGLLSKLSRWLRQSRSIPGSH